MEDCNSLQGHMLDSNKKRSRERNWRRESGVGRQRWRGAIEGRATATPMLPNCGPTVNPYAAVRQNAAVARRFMPLASWSLFCNQREGTQLLELLAVRTSHSTSWMNLCWHIFLHLTVQHVVCVVSHGLKRLSAGGIPLTGLRVATIWSIVV